MAGEITVCLIDDTPAEVVLYQKAYSSVPGVNAIAALTLEEFQSLGVVPDKESFIFTLDVAYVLGEGPDEERVASLLSSPSAIRQLEGERAAILRDAYINSVLAAQYFAELQDATVNHTRGGIRLARAVHEAYPDVPIVGYSRKTPETSALVYLWAAEAVGFFRKPNDLFSWEATESLTVREARGFVEDWAQILDLGAVHRKGLRDSCRESAKSLLERPGIWREQAIREGLQDFLPPLCLP